MTAGEDDGDLSWLLTWESGTMVRVRASVSSLRRAIVVACSITASPSSTLRALSMDLAVSMVNGDSSCMLTITLSIERRVVSSTYLVDLGHCDGWGILMEDDGDEGADVERFTLWLASPRFS